MAEARTSKWYWNGKNYKSRALMMAAKNAGSDVSVADVTDVTTPGISNDWSRLAGDPLTTAGTLHPWEDTQTFQPHSSYAPNTGFNSGQYAANKISGLNFGRINPDQQMQNYHSGTPDDTKDKGWFNQENMSAFASGAAGLGSLASGWAALKNLKLSRQALENQQNQWQTDYESQRLTTNNAIANQNAWKQAQGRTDFGAYVGGKPPGTNYVG